MTSLKTTEKQKMELYSIATQMQEAGLPDKFITDAVDLGLYYEGVYDLFTLWKEEKVPQEKDRIIADIQEAIDEEKETPGPPIQKPRISFDELDEIAEKVVAFKSRLRKIVDQRGGITKLARKMGTPQPSLSRFFQSTSMPRRTTLYKIAQALDLPEKDINTEWLA